MLCDFLPLGKQLFTRKQASKWHNPNRSIYEQVVVRHLNILKPFAIRDSPWMMWWMVVLAASPPLLAQTLILPPRPENSPKGTQFIGMVTALALQDRENFIYSQIANGNVPNFQRNLVPVTVSAVINGTNHTATYYISADYLAIGSDEDYFLEPMTPILAQQVANLLNCTMPTRKMVNQIWTNAPVKLAPSPIPPSPQMTTVPVFAQHNATVRGQRNAQTNSSPLGAVVSGDKKDVVISNYIYNNLHAGVPRPVVIYGWHQLDGPPIQPLYNGHGETYADYSHGVRLAQNTVTVDGASKTISQVLNDPNLAALLSDEGTIPMASYPVPQSPPIITAQPYSQTVNSGTHVAFRVIARNALNYQWQFNGTKITTATNSILEIANAQLINAGSYAVIVTNNFGSVTSMAAMLRVKTENRSLLFSDNFDTDTSTNWNLFAGTGDGIPDYTADWAF